MKRGCSVLVAAAMSLLAGGCATTATIRRQRGPTIEATIDRSDATALYATTPQGPRYRIERSDVVDIDHPGNLAMGVGCLFATAGAGLLAIGYSARNPSGFVGIPVLMGWMSVVGGVPLALAGMWSWVRSHVAVRAAQP
jgi:hypothetical protein